MSGLILSEPQKVLEVVYELELSETEWVHRLTGAIGQFIDGGSGTLGCLFRLGGSKPLPEFFPVGAEEQIPPFVRLLKAADRASTGLQKDSERYGRLFAGAGIGTGSVNRVGTPANDQFQRVFGRAGMGDAAGFLVAHRVSRTYILFTSGHPEPTVVPSKARVRWDSLQTHVSAMLDLRYRMQNKAFEETDAAWFEPSGRCVERGPAEADARKQLQALVRQHESSRANGASSSRVDASQYWANVLSGKWALVDRFDTDGRRFVIAVPVGKAGGGLLALTRREREITNLLAQGLSNGEIAYELDITETNVSSHLRGAYHKLGVQNRTELLRLLSGAIGRREK